MYGARSGRRAWDREVVDAAATPRQSGAMHGSYAVTCTTRAEPSQVWPLLLDARTWPQWGTVDALVLDQCEHLSADGHDTVGAVRAFRTGRVVTRERVVELRPYECFAYYGVDNPVLSDYTAEIVLGADPAGGTLITWHGSYRAAFGMHLLLRLTLGRTMQRMVDGLARAAVQPADGL